MKQSWDEHYTKEKSILQYPDENLVRMLSKKINDDINKKNLNIIDIGCGTGRHLKYIKNSGIALVIGVDYSLNALKICNNIGLANLVNCNNNSMPFKDNIFDIAISWGSLHYSYKRDTPLMLKEIKRILKPDGMLFATLRKDSDTYLKNGAHIENNVWKTNLSDLSGSVVSFYNEDEVKLLFKDFANVKYGWMERTIIGDTSKIIAHWIISAQK